MLKFIRRYQQQLKNIKPMPRSLVQINQLFKSSYNGQFFWIKNGIKRGQYHFIDYYHESEFNEFSVIPCSSISSACATAYRVIKNEPDFTDNFQVNWNEFDNLLTKFPKKYQDIVEDLLLELYSVDSKFDEICDLKRPSELENDCFDSGVDPEVFAYIIHDALTYSEIIRSEDLGLYQYLSEKFEIEPINSWATGLYLKEPVMTSQDKYRQKNQEQIRQSDRQQNANNPVYSFRPSSEIKEYLELKRKPGQTNQDLLSTLIFDSFPDMQFSLGLPDSYGYFLFLLENGEVHSGIYDHFHGEHEPRIQTLKGDFPESKIKGFWQRKTLTQSRK